MNNTIIKIVKVILFALPAIALFAPNDMFFPFITGKAFAFRVAVEVCFFIYLALIAVDSSYYPKRNALTIGFLFFTVVMFVADYFAIDPTRAFWSNFERMDGFVTLAHLFAYFIVISSVFKEKRDWRTWMLSTVAVSVFMSFFCFLQLGGELTINQGGVRVDGQLGNAAYLAVYMLFHIFFLLYLFIGETVDFKEITKFVSAGGLTYALYYLWRITNPAVQSSKVGMILLAVSILVSAILIFFRYSKKFAKSHVTIARATLGVLLVTEFVVLYYTATRGAILGLIGGVVITCLYYAWGWKGLLVPFVFGIIELVIELTGHNSARSFLLVLSCLFVSFVLGLVSLYRSADKEKVSKMIAGSVPPLLVVLAIIFTLLMNTAFVQNNPVLSRFAGLSLDTQGQARNYIWPMAIEGFKEHPYLGWGQDGFVYVFIKHYVPQMITQEPWFDRAHNSFLDWLVAGGSLGFLGYISLYIFGIIALWRSVAFSLREKAVLLGLFAAYSFQNIFIFDNLLSYLFFVSLLALMSFKKVDPSSAKKDTAKPIGIPMLTACTIIFVIVLVLVNGKLYRQNITLIQALNPQPQGISSNLDLIKQAIAYNAAGTFEARTQLESLTYTVLQSQNVPQDQKMAFANLTVQEFQNQIKETPDDVRPYLAIGGFLSSVGAYDGAIPVLEKALALSPKKQQTAFALANAYLSKGQKDKDTALMQKGVDVLKTVYDFTPTLDQVAIPYATSLVMVGDIDKAVPIILTVHDVSSFVDANTVKAIVDKGHAQDAVTILENAVKQNPTNSNAYVLLSSVYFGLHDEKDSVFALRRLSAAVPTFESSAQLEANIKAIEDKFR